MASANLVVFWICLIDPFETGAFLFFIPAGIGAFAVLGFSESKTGLMMAVFSALLFLIAYTSGFRPVPVPDAPPGYLITSFIFNYFVSVTICVLIVFFQMSLNRASEEELLRKEKFANQKNSELKKVNEELDRFVYSVSHDLRSPLSSILGLINIARHTQDRPELEEILDMIQGRVNSQDHFIREIIDYSRNARTETTIERIRVNELVEEIILSLRYHHGADRIDFRNTVPSELVVHSDKIRLRVILSNLIGNAIKYHDLKKEEPFIEVRADVEEHALIVEDNGSGMTPEHRERIFHMFYRASDQSTGSGLGLFITQEAVVKLDGAIKVSSTHGKGSTFTVLLPLQKWETISESRPAN